jgi:hypothetical protein
MIGALFPGMQAVLISLNHLLSALYDLQTTLPASP